RREGQQPAVPSVRLRRLVPPFALATDHLRTDYAAVETKRAASTSRPGLPKLLARSNLSRSKRGLKRSQTPATAFTMLSNNSASCESLSGLGALERRAAASASK